MVMNKVLILKGLPASGKTTWAKKQKGWKRINKDDLREMLDNGEWTPDNEEFVLKVRDKIITECMMSGHNVIVDDTNFSQKHISRISELVVLQNAFAEDINNYYQMGQKFFDTDVDLCIKRDRQRAKPVGHKVIRDMYKKYLKKNEKPYKPKENTPRAIICDLDGTLAILNGRNPYDAKGCSADGINEKVAAFLQYLDQDNYCIIFVSGRFNTHEAETKEWLKGTGLNYERLFMRQEGDQRKDAIVKREIFDNYIRDLYDVRLVLDDRNQVVDMWRDLGLTCWQVGDGNF